MLGSLIDKGLVDAVSLDVKAPWRDYPHIAGSDGGPVCSSLEPLKNSGINLEARTTFVPDIMTLGDLKEIQTQIGPGVDWVIQLFRPGKTLDPSLNGGTVPDRASLEMYFPGLIVR